MPVEPLDQLYTAVARKILSETIHVKKGDAVTIEAWDNGIPFARRAVAEARAMGCTAILILEDEAAYVEGVRRAPKEAIGVMGKNEYGLLAATDAYIFIPGQALGVYSRTLKPEELADSTRYNSSWYDAAAKAGLRGARLTFGYVGEDLAKLLGKRIDDITRAQLKASLIDFRKIGALVRVVSPLMADGTVANLRSGNSSLKFILKGELEVNDGIIDSTDLKTGNNMHYALPGLATKEVDPGSADGHVTLTDSLTKYGVLPHAELEFRRGKLVAWRSEDSAKIKRLVSALPPEKRTLKVVGMGFHPTFGYGYGQDRFVGGAVTLGGFGFTGLVKRGTLSFGTSKVLDRGKLTHLR